MKSLKTKALISFLFCSIFLSIPILIIAAVHLIVNLGTIAIVIGSISGVTLISFLMVILVILGDYL